MYYIQILDYIICIIRSLFMFAFDPSPEMLIITQSARPSSCERCSTPRCYRCSRGWFRVVLSLLRESAGNYIFPGIGDSVSTS